MLINVKQAMCTVVLPQRKNIVFVVIVSSNNNSNSKHNSNTSIDSMLWSKNNVWRDPQTPSTWPQISNMEHHHKVHRDHTLPNTILYKGLLCQHSTIVDNRAPWMQGIWTSACSSKNCQDTKSENVSSLHLDIGISPWKVERQQVVHQLGLVEMQMQMQHPVMDRDLEVRLVVVMVNHHLKDLEVIEKEGDQIRASVGLSRISSVICYILVAL